MYLGAFSENQAAALIFPLTDFFRGPARVKPIPSACDAVATGCGRNGGKAHQVKLTNPELMRWPLPGTARASRLPP